MAHRDPIDIGVDPVDLSDGETAGGILIGQVLGGQPVTIADLAAEPVPGVGPAGFSYRPGEFFQITVEDAVGNWAWCAGFAQVSLADG